MTLLKRSRKAKWVLAVATLAAILIARWFYVVNDRSPKTIVDALNSSLTIKSVGEEGLVTADGRMLPLPDVPKPRFPASVARDILDHGVEVTPDGSVYGLVRVVHWCGNDPVRFHLARIDLTSLLIAQEQCRASAWDDGIDLSLFGFARSPHAQIEEIFSAPQRH